MQVASVLRSLHRFQRSGRQRKSSALLTSWHGQWLRMGRSQRPRARICTELSWRICKQNGTMCPNRTGQCLRSAVKACLDHLCIHAPRCLQIFKLKLRVSALAALQQSPSRSTQVTSQRTANLACLLLALSLLCSSEVLHAAQRNKYDAAVEAWNEEHPEDPLVYDKNGYAHRKARNHAREALQAERKAARAEKRREEARRCLPCCVSCSAACKYDSVHSTLHQTW